MYTIGEFAKRVGVVPKTLQRWDREGRLKAHRTVTNQRYYTDEDLTIVLGLEKDAKKKRSIVYCRVSSPAQKTDLVNQRHNLEQFCTARGLVVDEWLEEIGGGLNFQRKQFLALVDRIIAGEVGMLVLAHKDRLARFGFSLIEHLCEVHQCELIVMNNQSLSPEQELTQDLLSILHCFSSRLDGLRNYRKTLKEALAHGSNYDQSPQDSPESNA
jgi:predicted site-specific integrase-resolvase